MKRILVISDLMASEVSEQLVLRCVCFSSYQSLTVIPRRVFHHLVHMVIQQAAAQRK